MSDETKPQDSAAMSPASADSQPAGWGAVASDGSVVCMMRRRADVASYVVDGAPIVPLYRSPTLTVEERAAIEYGVLLCDATAGCANDRDTIDGASRAADVLRGLLERTRREREGSRAARSNHEQTE